MKVLIVDDDCATVDVIKNTLNWKKLGVAKVFTAYNIEQAKEHLLNHAIPIIISDIEMPQGSGIELLAWFRGQDMKGEFLFLTSHESFDYATNAIKLHAAEYLLKPFDVAVMEVALKKIIWKIEEERQQQEDIAYGKWAKKNQRQLRLSFWERVLDGRITKELEEEQKQRNLELDLNAKYQIVVSRVTDIEEDIERMNSGLFRFILENLHSEVLCGNPENLSVLCYEYKDYYVMVTICIQETARDIEKLCRELIKECGRLLSATITCCISQDCIISDLCEVFRRVKELLSTNVSYYGSCFFESQAKELEQVASSLLDFEQMEELLKNREKIHFMSCLKEALNKKVYDRTLNEQTLLRLKQEVLQIVYTYFAKRGIPVSGFFLDEVSVSLTQKATISAIDMVRWVNYLLQRTYEYEEEARKGQTVVEKINQYIRRHYKENIGRNDIATEFFLAPEYISRMYKKQTGISLKDYINKYRIEQAKLLLKNEELRISDVAEEVGFDNFAYFSTMFKKYTGMTPNQYRKN